LFVLRELGRDLTAYSLTLTKPMARENSSLSRGQIQDLPSTHCFDATKSYRAV
jgi:hypothetical protein